MNDLFTYELVNFLPFSAEVYERLFTRLNETVWPLQLVALLAFVAIAWAILGQRSRVAFWVTAVIWASVAYFFFVELYASLLWAAPYIGLVFVAQTALLGFVGWRRPQFVSGYLGPAIFALSVVAWPFWYVVMGRDWSGVDLFGIAPDATALGTLALLVGLGRRAWFLGLIPLAWCLVSSATLHAMEMPFPWVTAVIGAAFFALQLTRSVTES